MQFPNGFDNAQNLGERPHINLGGHHMIIRAALERQTRTGKPMIELTLDTAPNDSQPGFFRREYDSKPAPEHGLKKWPMGGMRYVVLVDNDGNTSSSFKNLVTSLEESNSGFMFPRSEFSVSILKGKKVGAVYGPEKDFYNGKTFTKHTIFWLIDDSKVEEAKVPAERETKAYKDNQGGGASGGSSVPDPEWMTVDEGEMGDLPFN